jgi:8-oxo-dGTP diphosphatase
MRIVPVACAIIVRADARVLVVQRSTTMSSPLLWEFPGGKIERDENAKECIAREIREELSVHFLSERELEPSEYRYPHMTVVLYPFLGRIDPEELQLTEHVDAAWVTVTELQTWDLTPPDVPIARRLMEVIRTT